MLTQLRPLLTDLSLQNTISGLSLFLITLTTAYITYNVLLHPLHHIPGPLLSRITPWYQLYHGLKGDRHIWLHRLHERYGSHVRVAPSFVSINTERGLREIYGHSVGKRSVRVRKAKFYNAFPAIKGVYNTHNVIDGTVHRRKRGVLSQAFSENALRGMESVVILRIKELCHRLDPGSEGSSDHVVRNMGRWFSYLSYDVMGELCFGKSFDMLESPGRREMIGLVDRAAYRHYVVSMECTLTYDTMNI